MFFVKGKQVHLFTGADFTKEDGTVVPGKMKLQLMVQTALKNGEVKNELLDISIPKDKYAQYKDKTNSMVEVEVGLIGKVTFYGI